MTIEMTVTCFTQGVVWTGPAPLQSFLTLCQAFGTFLKGKSAGPKIRARAKIEIAYDDVAHQIYGIQSSWDDLSHGTYQGPTTTFAQLMHSNADVCAIHEVLYQLDDICRGCGYISGRVSWSGLCLIVFNTDWTQAGIGDLTMDKAALRALKKDLQRAADSLRSVKRAIRR